MVAIAVGDADLEAGRLGPARSDVSLFSEKNDEKEIVVTPHWHLKFKRESSTIFFGLRGPHRSGISVFFR